jgi:hypothetical protein
MDQERSLTLCNKNSRDVRFAGKGNEAGSGRPSLPSVGHFFLFESLRENHFLPIGSSRDGLRVALDEVPKAPIYLGCFRQHSHKIVILSGAPHRFIA